MVRKLKINLNPRIKPRRPRSVPPPMDDDEYNPKKPSSAKPASQPTARPARQSVNRQANTQRVEIHQVEPDDEPTAEPATEPTDEPAKGPALRNAKRPPRVYEDSAGMYIMDQGKKKRLVNTQNQGACGNHQANTQTLNLVLSGLVSKAKRKPRAPRAPKLKPDGAGGKDGKDGSAADGELVGGPGGKTPPPSEQAKDPRYILGAQMKKLIDSGGQNKRDVENLLKRINLVPAGTTLSLLAAIKGRNPLFPGVALPSWVDFARGDRLGEPPAPSRDSAADGGRDAGRAEDQKINAADVFGIRPSGPEQKKADEKPEQRQIAGSSSDGPVITEIPETEEERLQREDRTFDELEAMEGKRALAAAAPAIDADDTLPVAAAAAEPTAPIMAPPDIPEVAAAAAPVIAPIAAAPVAAAAAPAAEEKKDAAPRQRWRDKTEEEKVEYLRKKIRAKIGDYDDFFGDEKFNSTIAPRLRDDPLLALDWYLKNEFIVNNRWVTIKNINALLRKYKFVSDKVANQLTEDVPETYKKARLVIYEKLTPEFVNDYFQARQEADDSTYGRNEKRAKAIYQNLDRLADERIKRDEEARKKQPTGAGKASRPLMVGLSDRQIDDMMRGYPEYMGCISRDEISRLNVPDVGRFGFVYNTVPSNKPTTYSGHWRAVFVDLDNDKEIDHYDSYGDPAEPDICAEIKKLLDPFKLPYYLKWKDNRIIEQRANSNNCGYFATNFLMDRFAGKPFKDATGYSNVAAGERKARGLNRKFKFLT
jgi:hypothetical protein